MSNRHSELSGNAPWSVDTIPYGEIARAVVRDDELLFALVASASFVEITSDIYASNLIALFGGDSEVVDWLARQWEPEEKQHGVALERYVRTAWPDFDWDAAYRSFFAEYKSCCLVDRLNSNHALEMAARCVVETGTASFYRMLSAAAPEPVLRTLAARISADEVRHYKHFYRFFLRYSARERLGRVAVLKALCRRMREIDDEDAYIAFKHVFHARYPEAAFTDGAYAEFRNGIRGMAQRHFPHDMAIKMLLKPLQLAPMIGRIVVPSVASATQRLLLRDRRRAA